MIWNILSLLALALPVAMTVLGLIAWRFPPKGPNWLLGFRGRRARASDESWLFAQNLAGILWFCLGLVLLLVTLLVSRDQQDLAMEQSITTYLTLLFWQLIVTVFIVVVTDVVLICRFDRFGRLRSQVKAERLAEELEDAEEEPEEEESYEPEEAFWDEFQEGSPADPYGVPQEDFLETLDLDEDLFYPEDPEKP